MCSRSSVTPPFPQLQPYTPRCSPDFPAFPVSRPVVESFMLGRSDPFCQVCDDAGLHQFLEKLLLLGDVVGP